MLNDNLHARDMLAAQLREMRERKGYSQETLAVMSGLHRSYIGSIERREHNIGLDNIERIARGLDVKIARLLDDEEPCDEPVHETRAVSVLKVVIETTELMELLNQYIVASQQPHLVLKYLEHRGVKLV